jgi:hypothetical protein
MLGIILVLVIIATSIWVAIDSSNLGAGRGALGGGFLDMGPASWFFVCLLLWIIGFPCYLVARSKLVAAKAVQASVAPGWPSAPATASPSVGAIGQTHGPYASALVVPVTPTAELERLYQLHRGGGLSAAEYDVLKQEVIGQRLVSDGKGGVGQGRGPAEPGSQSVPSLRGRPSQKGRPAARRTKVVPPTRRSP